MTAAPHPAKFSASVLREIRAVLDREGVQGVILDPFAGVGGVHSLATPDRPTIGVELEPEWAKADSRTMVGDACRLPVRAGSVAAIVTSPTFGNRMADHHSAKDQSRRYTYRSYLGRMPSRGSSTTLQWGPGYQVFHRRAYGAAYEALEVGGLAVINISNFIRSGKVMEVSEWTYRVWVEMGARPVETIQIDTPRLRHGRNHQARVDYEQIHVFRKGPAYEQLRLWDEDGWDQGQGDGV